MNVRCHYCEMDLPEKGCTHIIHAAGQLHRGDPLLPYYTVCTACLKFHKLKMRQLQRPQ